MDTNTLLAGTILTGAGVGLIAAFWSKFKALAWRFANLFVVRISLDGQAGIAVAYYLWKHGKRSRYGERAYSGEGMFVRPEDRHMVVAFESIGNDASVFWLGRVPALVSMSAQKEGTHFMGMKLTLTFVRGTLTGDGVVQKAVDEYNVSQHGGSKKRFAIHRATGSRRKRSEMPTSSSYDDHKGISAIPGSSMGGQRYLRWTESELGPPVPVDPLGPLAFPPAVESLYHEAKQWLASEKFYKGRRIPWRRGWLLYGPPGTGKTSLAKAVAQELDLPVFAMELATLSDEELIEMWGRALTQTPCMILLEDLDAVFKGRQNRLGEQGGGLNFGCLLNCASGVVGTDGVLLVVTTNNLEDIDPAMGVPDATGRSTRPGRIDRAVELGTMDAACRQRLAARILADWPDEVEGLVAAGDGATGSQFQEMCCAVALRRHWEGSAHANIVGS